MDFHVAGLLHLDFLLANVTGDVLGILGNTLADLDFLGHRRVLADVDLMIVVGVFLGDTRSDQGAD